MIKEVKGYCPMLNKTQTIEVKYAEIPILGRMKPGYKMVSFSCPADIHSSCTYGDDCPLLTAAPTAF